MINEKGAIKLGKYFEVDGYDSRPIRVITHFHSDHLIDLNKSKKHAEFIVATQPTLDALKALGYKIMEDKMVSLNYYNAYNHKDETLILLPSNHIFGSSQVLLHLPNEKRVGYTSDFKLDNTIIMEELDALVVDATYGSPEMTRPFKHEVPGLLVDIVHDALSKDMTVTIHGYYGKLQEVMELLRETGVTAPYLMPKRVYELTKVAVTHGFKISEYYLEEEEEAKEIKKNRWYIYFKHMNSRKKRTGWKEISIYLTGWMFSKPVRKVINNNFREEWWVAYSDHADFNETLAYIEEARPKMLVVDGYRAGERIAKRFADEVSQKLRVKVEVQPITKKV